MLQTCLGRLVRILPMDAGVVATEIAVPGLRRSIRREDSRLIPVPFDYAFTMLSCVLPSFTVRVTHPAFAMRSPKLYVHPRLDPFPNSMKPMVANVLAQIRHMGAHGRAPAFRNLLSHMGERRTRLRGPQAPHLLRQGGPNTDAAGTDVVVVPHRPRRP